MAEFTNDETAERKSNDNGLINQVTKEFVNPNQTDYDLLAKKIILDESNTNCHNPIQKIMESVLPKLVTIIAVLDSISFMTRQLIMKNMTSSRTWFCHNMRIVRKKIGNDLWKKKIAKAFGNLLAVCEKGNTVIPRTPRWMYCLIYQLGMNIDLSKKINMLPEKKHIQFNENLRTNGNDNLCEPIVIHEYYPNGHCFSGTGGVIYKRFWTEDNYSWIVMLVRKSISDYWLPYTCVPSLYVLKCIHTWIVELRISQTEHNIIQMFGYSILGKDSVTPPSKKRASIEKIVNSHTSGYEILVTNKNEGKIWRPILDWQLQIGKCKMESETYIPWTIEELYNSNFEVYVDNRSLTATDAEAIPYEYLEKYVIKTLSESCLDLRPE